MADWRVAKCIPPLFAAFNQNYPERSKTTGPDGTIASTTHHQQNPSSDHDPDENGIVRAADISHDPAHGCDTYQIADYMRMHPDPRARYIISNGRICGNADFCKKNYGGNHPSWTWFKYTGENPHDHHMHVSMVRTALADSDTPWDIGPILAPKGPVAQEMPPTIRKGSHGATVVAAQRVLGIDPDGDFGPKTVAAVKAFQTKNGLVADGVVGPATWRALQTTPPVRPISQTDRTPIPLQKNIIASVFGGEIDSKLNNNVSAYTGNPLTSSAMYVALPFRFEPASSRPTIIVTNPKNGRTAVGRVEDVGPWDTNNPYWQDGSRPLAEISHNTRTPMPRGPNKGKIANGAGIDISMAMAKTLGIDGMGEVNWEEAS